MEELDYSDQLNALRAEDPLCESIHAKLLHCLTEEQLRLALLLKTHSPNGQPFEYQVGFITNGEVPFVSSGFSADRVTGDKFSSQIDCVFRGVWILKLPQQKVDLRIGEGTLRVTAYDQKKLDDTDRFRPLGDEQLGYIWLMNRSVTEDGFPDGTLELEVEKFDRFFRIMRDSPFAFWFDGLAPCAPGYKGAVRRKEMLGQIFSIGFSEVVFTNGGSLNLREQGGELFFMELENIPANKIQLVKYLNSRLGLPVSQITENLTDKIGPKWVVYSGADLSEISEIFVELERLGAAPRVYTEPS